MGTDDPPATTAFKRLPLAIPPQYSSEYKNSSTGKPKIDLVDPRVFNITTRGDQFGAGTSANANLSVCFAALINYGNNCRYRLHVIHHGWASI